MSERNYFEEITTAIQSRYPSVSFEIEFESQHLLMRFDNGFQKDYTFYLGVEKGITQSTIGASLKVDSKEKYYFWSLLNDLYKSEGPELEWTLKFLIENMEIILNHRTRIIQRKGWINMIFTLEYYKDGDWKSLGSTMAFRYSHFKFPKLEKGQKEKMWY
jgi:hypothetical protein